MAKQIVSRKKAQFFSFLLFSLGVALLAYLQSWWPSIVLVLGLSLALREYLSGRKYDVFVTLFIFVGIFVTIQFRLGSKFFLPVLFIVAGIYLFFREFFGGSSVTEAEKEEDLNQELREEKKD